MQQIDPKEFAGAYEELKTGLDSITDITRKLKPVLVHAEPGTAVPTLREGLDRIDLIAGLLGATLRGMAF